MNTKYTNDHEWARIEGDSKNPLVVVGITDYAQGQLGEIVFVEPPEVGRNLKQGEEAAVIESVKAAGEVKSPLSGEVVEVNEELDDSPETVNDEPMGAGWIYKIKPADADKFAAELADLMDDDAYNGLVESLA